MRIVFNSTKKLYACVIFTALAGASCTTLKPYEKEYLLHPTMDDATVSRLDSGFQQNMQAQQQRLLGSGSGSSGATSCPTCGG